MRKLLRDDEDKNTKNDDKNSKRFSRRELLRLSAFTTAAAVVAACAPPASVSDSEESMAGAPAEPAGANAAEAEVVAPAEDLPSEETVELEVQQMMFAALSYAETFEDINESAEILCDSQTPDKRLVDLHFSYFWDLVDRQEIMAESAEHIFSAAQFEDAEFAWDAEAFRSIVENPQLEPLIDILEIEPAGEEILELESNEAALAYLGISQFTDIPGLLRGRAEQFTESLRNNPVNVSYREPCVDPAHIQLASYGFDTAFAVGATAFASWIAYEFFSDLFGGSGGGKGKAARKQIEEMSDDEIASLGTEEIKELLFEMMKGGTGNKKERAVLKVLRAIGCDRAIDELFYTSDVPHKEGKSVPKKHYNWFSWIFNTMSGKEKSELGVFLTDCGLFTHTYMMNRNEIRNFVEHANHGTLSSLTDDQIGDMLRRTLDGNVGSRREWAIYKLILSLYPSCERVKMALADAELSRQDFADKVQGTEWVLLDSLLRPCGV